MGSTVVLGVVGHAMALGLLAFIWRAHATRWNRLASAYASPPMPVDTPRRAMQTLILTGGWFGFSSYRGVVTVQATETDVTLSLPPLCALFHPALTIPACDVRARETVWYVNARSYRLSFAAAPGVEIVIDHDLMEWIGSRVAAPLTPDELAAEAARAALLATAAGGESTPVR
ncbi:MAG: hypothetical protein AAF805_06205 [Planctomycetota bacterium]